MDKGSCPKIIPVDGKVILCNDTPGLESRSRSLSDVRSLSESPKRYIRWLMKLNAAKKFLSGN